MSTFQPPVPPQVVAPAWHTPRTERLTDAEAQEVRERLKFAVRDVGGTIDPQILIDWLMHELIARGQELQGLAEDAAGESI